MTQFFYNLSKWRKLVEGEVLHYSNPMPRTVRLEVNSPERTRLMVSEPRTGEFDFLAVVDGRDCIEFSADGPFDLTIDEGELFLYTIDSTDWSVEAAGFESFTKIVERRTRNPELEYMMEMTYRNMEKRFAQQQRELEQQFERRLARRDARAAAAAASEEKPDKSGGTGDGGKAGSKQREAIGDAPDLGAEVVGAPDEPAKPKAK